MSDTKKIKRARTFCRAKFERDRAQGIPFDICAEMFHDTYAKLTGIDLRKVALEKNRK